MWQRAPEHDRRIAHSDDWAGDAWRTETGELRWCVVGHKPREGVVSTELLRHILKA